MTKKLTLALLLSLTMGSGLATAEIFVAPKHLIMIKPGVDKIYGNYVFAVVNQGTDPVEYEVPVSLPKEVEDFVVEEGATQDEVLLGSDGGLTVKKVFAPGTNLISFRFFGQATSPVGQLTLQPKVDIGELTLLVDKAKLTVSAKGITKSDATLGGDDLVPWVLSEGIAAGSSFVIDINGIPSGRGGFWTMGWIFAVVLVIAVAVLTLLTMPSREHDDQGELLLGEG